MKTLAVLRFFCGRRHRDLVTFHTCETLGGTLSPKPDTQAHEAALWLPPCSGCHPAEPWWLSLRLACSLPGRQTTARFHPHSCGPRGVGTSPLRRASFWLEKMPHGSDVQAQGVATSISMPGPKMLPLVAAPLNGSCGKSPQPTPAPPRVAVGRAVDSQDTTIFTFVCFCFERISLCNPGYS